MKKKAYKFEKGQLVFILGRPGICRILQRGTMESGHKIYGISGAHSDWHIEELLLSQEEGTALYGQSMLR